MIDPLLRASDRPAKALFGIFAREANGFPADAVINASINMLLNVLRQAYPTRERAEKRFDELMGRSKQLLLDHYQNGTRLQGVYPFKQTIHANLVELNDDAFGDELEKKN